MAKRKENDGAVDDGTYVVKKNRKMNIISFIICFLVAFILWIYATNLEKKNGDEAQTGTAVSSEQAVNEATLCFPHTERCMTEA